MKLRIALALLAVAALATGLAPAARAATVVEPHADAFYRPSAGFESAAPGAVLRSRAVSVNGLGIPLPVTATQMLVRSTDAHGLPMAIATTVMVPKLKPANGSPRPLLTYQPAIDSLGDQCQPSYTLRAGTEKEIPNFLAALALGWVVVVSDYQGPKNAYGAGRLEGQATLDGVRAALHTPGAGLSARSKVAMTGYSGGALATGWAAQLAPTYAPELNIVGVAVGGTPGDLEAAGRKIDGGPAAGLFLAAVIGVSREYPEILTLLNAKGRALVSEFNDLCVYQEASRHFFTKLADYSTVADPLGTPIGQSILHANRMGAVAPKTPVYMFHAFFDELIPYASVQTLNHEWCRGGTKVRFVTDFASEHISYAISGEPGALAYLIDRVNGRKVPNDCTP